MAGAAAAQFGGGFGFGPRYVPARFPDADTFGHGFVFCRGIYRSDRREAGGTGWSTDYPDAELNFSIRLSELTKARIIRGADGKPVHVTVRLTDDSLFKCPYLHMEDVGTMALSDEEVRKLREYLLKGGFLWVDDYWGDYAWDQWVEQIARVLPPARVPDRRSAARAPDLAVAVPVEGAAADSRHPVVAPPLATTPPSVARRAARRTSAASPTRTAACSW